jgi:hypothetical protein
LLLQIINLSLLFEGKRQSLVLRTCKPDFTSTRDFQLPSGIGAVTIAKDWLPTGECGNGLHVWLYGIGDATCVDYWQIPNARWLALEVLSESVIDLEGKCKFPKATIRFIGNKIETADFILANEPRAKKGAVIGACRAVGDFEQVEVGDLGRAIAGYEGVAVAGFNSIAEAGYLGTASAGRLSCAIAGGFGKAVTKNNSRSIAGPEGTAITGVGGWAIAGIGGRAQAGKYGQIQIDYIAYSNKGEQRIYTQIGYVGEDGIEADTLYGLNKAHKFVKVKS